MMLNACFLWPFWSSVDKCKPRIIKTLCFTLMQVESGSTQDLDAHKWDAVSWPGLLGGIQDQHQAPAPCMRKGRSPRRKIPTHTPTEQGQNDRKNGGQDWIWTHPTSGEKVPEGSGWKGSRHEFASLMVMSTALLWVRGNPPLQWLRSTL